MAVDESIAEGRLALFDAQREGETPAVHSPKPTNLQAIVPTPARTSIRNVLIILAGCWAVEMTARFLYLSEIITAASRDLMGMGAFCMLTLATIYAFARVRSVPRVQYTLMAGLVILIVSQVSDVVDEFGFAQHYPLLAKNHMLHLTLEHCIFISGCLLLVAGCFIALFEGEFAVRQREAEHLRLLWSVAEKEAAELALMEGQRALEAEVIARTAELAERNAQLNAELADRRRFEVSLANRLRYEEGLAACSNVLLAGFAPEEAIRKGLEHLLTASRASRVYIFETCTDPELGSCMTLSHEVWDDRKCSWCEPSPGLTIPYSSGLERWREMLSTGNHIAGTVENLPPREQAFLERFRTKSVLLLPLGWEGRWRGFIGFDDTLMPRDWSEDEIRILKTAAEMVGACKERQRAEDALRIAYDHLESRVDERTADLRKTNEELERALVDRRKVEVDKQKLETQLRQAQKMQAIGTLAGGIAHDFNNILASILGYAELAIRRMEGEPRHKKYLDEILSAAHRARELVRQILLFSRQAEQEREPVHLNLIAQEVMTLIRAANTENIKIHDYVDSGTITVLGDAVQLHQVLLNLCTNAQHAMKDTGGELELRVETIEMTEETSTSHGSLAPGEYALISVSDTGAGIDGQTIERIFEPFFTTKSVCEGTGMGLAIVHGIVTGMKGTVTVQSQRDHGSIFHVYLPLNRSEAQPNLNISAYHVNGDEHILVVDDEPQLVALWMELLGQFGYQVTGQTNSRRALETFDKDPHQFDVVLMDQTMPGITGAELAKHMLEIRPDLPIIIATGFSETISPEIAESIGIRELVYKPILGHDLCASIRRALDGPVPSDAAELSTT